MRRGARVIVAAAAAALLAGCASGGASAVQVSNTKSTSEVLAEMAKEESGGSASVEEAENSVGPVQEAASSSPAAEVDVDLTEMSSDMVYATVYDMVTRPGEYEGKTVRLSGSCMSSYYEFTGKTYHYALVSDAQACCSQGLEYELSGGEYRSDGAEAVVVGAFSSYEEEAEDGQAYTYVVLTDARYE